MQVEYSKTNIPSPWPSSRLVTRDQFLGAHTYFSLHVKRMSVAAGNNDQLVSRRNDAWARVKTAAGSCALNTKRFCIRLWTHDYTEADENAVKLFEKEGEAGAESVALLSLWQRSLDLTPWHDCYLHCLRSSDRWKFQQQIVLMLGRVCPDPQDRRNRVLGCVPIGKDAWEFVMSSISLSVNYKVWRRAKYKEIPDHSNLGPPDALSRFHVKERFYRAAKTGKHAYTEHVLMEVENDHIVITYPFLRHVYPTNRRRTGSASGLYIPKTRAVTFSITYSLYRMIFKGGLGVDGGHHCHDGDWDGDCGDGDCGDGDCGDGDCGDGGCDGGDGGGGD